MLETPQNEQNLETPHLPKQSVHSVIFVGVYGVKAQTLRFGLVLKIYGPLLAIDNNTAPNI